MNDLRLDLWAIFIRKFIRNNAKKLFVYSFLILFMLYNFNTIMEVMFFVVMIIAACIVLMGLFMWISDVIDEEWK